MHESKMEKLWKKEANSVAANSLYVDLFANPHNDEDYKEWDNQLIEDCWKHEFSDVMTVWPKKSNETSNRFRSMGNSVYTNTNISLPHRLYASMELYNESLRYAETGTENLGLAYANRSACFLNLQMYGKCLTDIGKAKKANYPSKLMFKLNGRKVYCNQLKRMLGETERLNEEPKLDFPADENFPSMANVVRITRNDEFGRLLEAKCDIDVGKTVLVDDAFVSVSTRTGTFCFTCLKRHQNFIPCTQCTDVVFCSINCMNESGVHKISCGALYHRMPISLKLPLQSILIAISTFPTVDELMDFVESNLKQNSDDYLPTSLLDARQKYAFFLTLKMLHNPTYDFTLRAYQTYTSLMAIPAIEKLFDTEQKRRFLMHLVTQHILIVHTNAFNAPNTGLPFDLASMACVLSLANHSCTPNLCNFGVDNREVCVTIRPIKKGEQLFISYVEEDEPKQQRQSTLQQNYGFECKCERCTRWTAVLTEHHYEMLMDPCFQHLLYPDATDLPGDDKAKCVERREMCSKFLNKFAHLKYSDAYDEVVNEFKKLLIGNQISDDNLTALPKEQ